MNFSSLRTVSAIAITALLTACGAGQTEVQSPMLLASSVQSEMAVPATGATSAAAAGVATGPAVAAAAGPNNPAPDCAADGCAGLRIIDGNAEAFRVDAMRRAATTEQG